MPLEMSSNRTSAAVPGLLTQAQWQPETTTLDLGPRSRLDWFPVFQLDPDGQVTSKLTSSKNKQNEEKKKKKKRKKKTAEKDPEKSNSPSSSSSSDDDNDDHDMGIHEAAVSTHWVLNKEGVYSWIIK